MSRFVNPTGHSTYGVGICDRCKRAFPLDELFPDPNSPGLKVCREDLDDYDPYRLPARQSENIVLPFTRPDVQFPVSLLPSFTLLTPYIMAENGEFIEDESGEFLVADEVVL